MKTKGKKHHIGLLIFASIAFMASLIAYAYVNQKVVSLTTVVIREKGILAIENTNNNQSQDLMTKYSGTAGDRAKLRGFFIPTSNEVAFIEAVEATGNVSGASVALSSISADPLDKAKPDSLGSIKGSVTANGSWTAVMKDLMLAENLPYDISIDNVRLTLSSPGTKSSSIWSLTYNISGVLIATTSLSS